LRTNRGDVGGTRVSNLRSRKTTSWRSAMAAVIMLVGCQRTTRFENEQEAHYAAEAGLELGRRHVARLCEEPERNAALHEVAAKGGIPLPGYERPSQQVLGRQIRGTVAVHLATAREEPTGWLVVSTGECHGVKKVLEEHVVCPALTKAASPASSKAHAPRGE
jgi:hypothetical protein